MTLLKVQPDKVYLITEERIRFAVDAGIEPGHVPFAIFKDLQKSIEILEKNRGWRHIETAPTRKKFPGGKPCCADITTKKSGEALTIKFVPSSFQGDLDDATNFDKLSDPGARLHVDNKVDWLVILHFWEPAVLVYHDKEKEYRDSIGLKDGIAPFGMFPNAAFSPKMQEKLKDVLT